MMIIIIINPLQVKQRKGQLEHNTRGLNVLFSSLIYSKNFVFHH